VVWLYLGVPIARAAAMLADGWEYAGADPRYSQPPFCRVWMRKREPVMTAWVVIRDLKTGRHRVVHISAIVGALAPDTFERITDAEAEAKRRNAADDAREAEITRAQGELFS
jgi:hypothetical protein